MPVFSDGGRDPEEEERRRQALQLLAEAAEARREQSRFSRTAEPESSVFRSTPPIDVSSETHREEQRIFRGPSVDEQQETRREATRDRRVTPSVFRDVSTLGRGDGRAEQRYTGYEPAAPGTGFRDALARREQMEPSPPPDERPVHERLGGLVDKSLGLIGLGASARERNRQAALAGQTEDREVDPIGDLFANLLPGDSAAKRNANREAVSAAISTLPIGSAIKGRPLQAASPDLGAAAKQGTKTAADTPGFAKTAEEKIRENASRAAASGADVASDAHKAATGSDLGYRPQMFADLDADIQKVMQTEAEGADGFVKQRRGTQTIADIDERSLEVATQQIRDTKIGQAMNAEELRAAARATARAAARRKALQDEITTAGGPQHASTELKTKLMLAAVDQASLQRAFAGGRTEAGRAMRVLREVLTEADVSRSRDAYDRALSVIGGRENQDQFIARLNDLWTRSVPDEVKEADTYRFLRGIGEAGKMDKAQEWFINSILSNPVTHEVNMISNALFAVMQPPTRFLAAGVEAVSTVGGRTRPREVFFSESAAQLASTLRGLQVGARKAVHIAREGYDLDDVARWTETGRLGRPQAIGGKLGTFINAPTRALAVEDAVFRSVGLMSELYAQAARIASKEKLTGKAFAARMAELVDAPTAEMMEVAAKHAKYVTFQSAPGKTTQHILGIRNTAGGLPRFVVPFVQTAVNLAKRGLEYSPAGAIVAVKSAPGEARSTALARAAIGSVVTGFFASKFVSGEITADAPKDQAARDEWFRSGKIPYAVRIGDRWVEFRRVEPLLTPLRYMASMYQAFQDSGGEVDFKAIGPVLGAFGATTVDASYMQGISDTMDAMEDPTRFGERWLTRFLSAAVPYSALLRNAAAAGDPYVRDPQDIGERVAAGLPGLSGTVRTRLDAYGQPVEREPSRQGALGFINPVKATDVKNDPVDAEVRRVREFAEIKPIGFVEASVGGQKLDPDEHHRWQELAGQAAYRRVQALITQPAYSQLSWDEKAQQIEDARKAARKDARVAFGLEMVRGSDDRKVIAKGTAIAVSGKSSAYDKGAVLAQLRTAGKLPPEAMAAVSTSWGDSAPARLARVTDGDTLHLDVPPELRPKSAGDSFRLLRVNTPERNQPEAWKKAKDALDGFLKGKQLVIQYEDSDNLSRGLIELTADGVNVSDWLVKRGYGKYDAQGAKTADVLLRIYDLAEEYKNPKTTPERRGQISKDDLWERITPALKGISLPRTTPKPDATPKPEPSATPGTVFRGPAPTPRRTASPSPSPTPRPGSVFR